MKPRRHHPLALALHTCCLGGLGIASAWAQSASPAGDPDPAVTLDRVVVTASKRSQSIRDVPGSVSAVTQAQLEALGAQSLADYVQKTPGVVFNNFQPGISHVVVRGIATNAGNVQGQPTTGYFLNEIPLMEPGWTIAVPDIDAFDLSRVEVLRGPQGSLFGSASMGGAINYIANVADPGGFDAALEAGISSTRNADLGHSLKGMVNLPVKQDLFAIRAVAQYRNAPGFLDNIGTGREGANDVSVTGGRLSAVLTPSEDTTLTWLSLRQETDTDDGFYRDPALGDLVRNTAIPEFNNTRVTVHSLRLDQSFGWADLTTLLSRQKKQQDWRFDFSPYADYYNGVLGASITEPFYINSGGDSTGNSLELRLTSAPSDRFEWLVGGMYFDTYKNLHEQLGAPGAAAAIDVSPNFAPGAGAQISPDGEVFNAFYSIVKGAEKALFGEASLHFNPQWTLTAGGRLFETRMRDVSIVEGIDTWPGPRLVTPTQVKESGFNPKLSLHYKPTERTMFYALMSEGFRFGTPNNTAITQHPIPAGSGSDKLVNYELGMRSDLFDRRLLFDVTAFYIDWSDIQLRLLTPAPEINYATNGGKAYSRGVELSMQWRPGAVFDWTSNITWQQARLKEDLFILWYGTAPEGARLPGSADWSISNVLTWRFAGARNPTLLLSHSYLSEGISDLNSAVPGVAPNQQGDYHQVDARFGLTFGQTDVTLYAANLTDERGVTRTVPQANGLGEGILWPRTYGVTFRWKY